MMSSGVTCPLPWQPGCISSAGYAMLHTNAPALPSDQLVPYAMGWAMNAGSDGGWAGASAIQHNGGLNGEAGGALCRRAGHLGTYVTSLA